MQAPCRERERTAAVAYVLELRRRTLLGPRLGGRRDSELQDRRLGLGTSDAGRGGARHASVHGHWSRLGAALLAQLRHLADRGALRELGLPGLFVIVVSLLLPG